MRVVHVITRLIVGGAQENTIASVLGLRRRPGVDVRLISGPTTGPEGSLQPLVESIPDLLTLVPSLVRPVNPFQDALALATLIRLLRSDQPEIVHTHSGKAGILGRLAARAARIPVILHTIHGPSFGPFQTPAANALFLRAERIAGRYTTGFVVVADAMARQYLAAGIATPDRFTRIYSGFDLDPYLAARNDSSLRARLGLAPGDFVVGKIARLFALKGHLELIEAAATLVRDIPSIRFLFVGDGSWRPRIESAIARQGLERHFVFTGLVPPASIPGLVGIMDVLVHLSRREGLPRALPQAMAAGRPVVAYDVDGAGEVCRDGETGFLVAPGDIQGLCERLRILAADSELRVRLGNHGRQLARRSFSLDRMIDELCRLYDRVLPTQRAESRSDAQPTPASRV